MKKICLSILNVEDEKKEEIINKVKYEDIYIHFDIMDKKFVKPSGVNLEYIKLARKYNKYADVHLMVNNPKNDDYIDEAINYGANSISIHYEIENFEENLNYLIKKREELKRDKRDLSIGIALRPSTDIKVIEKYKNDIDKVLIMSVEPGYGGQKYIENTDLKIKEARKIYKDLKIEVDGGINYDVIRKNNLDGVEEFVIGNYLVSSENISLSIKNINDIIN